MSPIERAALALYTADAKHGLVDHASDPLPHNLPTGETLARYIERARAVLAAIREPSEGMMTAAHEIEADFDSAAGHRDRGRTYGQFVWPAMIDALLEEGK